jgi:hypothetical protein
LRDARPASGGDNANPNVPILRGEAIYCTKCLAMIRASQARTS